MKRYLIPTVAILMVLAVVLAAFGQQERRGGQLSEEERAKMRERFQNMSEEERAKFREQMRGRGGGFMMSPEEQQKAIKVIEGQLAKLKAAQLTRPEGGFQDLSEEERTKLREKMRTASQERRNALQTIIAQVAMLQGRRGPAPEAAEDVQYLIISTSDLKPIQDAAIKEKAKETSELLGRLIARGSGGGFGGRQPGGERPQGGQRGGGRRSTGQQQ